MQLQTLNIIHKLKSVLRLVLMISSVSLILSSILVLVFGNRALDINEVVLSTVIWYSIILGLWISILSIALITASVVIYKVKNIKVWSSLKREIKLTVGTIVSLVILYLCCLALR